MFQISLAASGGAFAEPWIASGDPWLKADAQRLADAGIITSPISSWPLSAGDVAQDVNAFRADEQLSDSVLRSLTRMRELIRDETKTGTWRGRASISAADNPELLRGFQNVPRGKAEASVSVDWTGDRFAFRLQPGYVDDVTDDKDFRADGSYVTAALGNWMIGAAAVDRWWGPGWGGSLILSNNARPIPALILEAQLLNALHDQMAKLDRALVNQRPFGGSWRTIELCLIPDSLAGV